MKTEITPPKKFPKNYSMGGDYYITHSALIIAAVTDGKTTLRNCSRGKDTEESLNSLEILGFEIIKDNSVIIISGNREIEIPEGFSLYFGGGLFPLALVIGYLAGRGQPGVLQYSENINQDIIDDLVIVLNTSGIDLFHDADSRQIIFRGCSRMAVETKVRSAYPYMKNCLLMFGLASGNAVNIKEILPASNHFEKTLRLFGVNVMIKEPKYESKEDPVDPRRKIRIRSSEYRRAVTLTSSCQTEPIELNIPPDYDITTALMALAVLRKEDIAFNNVVLNSRRMGFINYLRSLGIEVNIVERKINGEFNIGRIHLRGKDIKARRISGEQVISARGSGTTTIRGIGEFNIHEHLSFREITGNLERMGVRCGIFEDGLVIEGTREINGADFGPIRNRKVALAFYIAALAGKGISTFEDFDIIAENYPEMILLSESYPEQTVVPGTEG
jgi:3-phosphoshikimate 1-carboxyvinyltransferase